MNYPFRLLSGLILLCLFSLAHASKGNEIIELDHVVAIVNNDVITASELSAKVKQIKQRMAGSGNKLPEDAILQKQILERMIIEEIQTQLAQQSGIRVDDEQLNNVIRNIAKQNKLSPEQFRKEIEKEGHTFKSFREQIRKEVMVAQLRRNKVENTIHVSEQEVDHQIARLENQLTLNDEFHLAHILVGLPESASPEQVDAAAKKANEIVAQLKLGADFSQTAMSVSDGQQALRGGDLGWIKRGQLFTIFADIIPKLQPGEITQPVRSPRGFHIIKLIDKRSQNQKRIIEQTLARHILIRTDQLTSDAEAREKLQRIYERILAGTDFGKIARASSDDTASAADGGSLGWTSPGKMVPEFENVMAKLKPGEVSKPFKSRFGWHIVQVMSRRQHDDTDEYLRNQARQQIHKRKVEEETENWLRRIRDNAYVEYRLNE